MLRKRDLASALAWLRLSDEQSRQLVALDPSNLDWQRDLGVSALALGDVLVEMRRFDAARVEMTRALEVLERIDAVSPGRATQDLAIALGHLADLEAQAGRMPAARAALARTQHRDPACDARPFGYPRGASPARRRRPRPLAGVESTSARSLARSLVLVTEARAILAPLRQLAADPDLAATFQLLDRESKHLGGK